MDYDSASDYHGSPGSDQVLEYYEISSSKSHVFEPDRSPFGNRSPGGREDFLDRPCTESNMSGVESRSDGWDAFKLQSVEVPTRCDIVFFNAFLQISKLAAYFITFLLILLSGVISKLCILLLTTNLLFTPSSDRISCAIALENVTQSTSAPLVVEEKEKYLAIIWSICFSILMPEILTWLSCFRKVILRQIQGPRAAMTWVLAFITETAYIIGLLLLLYDVTARTDIVSGLMLTNACCTIPAISSVLHRHCSETFFIVRLIFDLVAVILQLTALIFWPIIDGQSFRWTLPVSLILISLRWWENYVSGESSFTFVRWLSQHRTNIGQAQCKVYLFVSLWKIILILAWIAAWHALVGPNNVNIFDIRNVFTGTSTMDLGGRVVNGTWVERRQKMWFWKPNAMFLLIALVAVTAGFVGNICGKYACRIRIHAFSFAVPLCLVTPAAVAVAVAVCAGLKHNACFMSSIIPETIRVRCPPFDSFWIMLESQYAWLWFLWLVSHWYTTLHIWKAVPERRRMNHLFSLPDFGSFPLDVSSTLNQMRHYMDTNHRHSSNFYPLTDNGDPNTSRKNKKKQPVAHLYICSFFDQQTETDVVETIKSIIRMDEEQCARRNAIRFLIESDPDYFEFESHLFFENAFLMDTLRGERVIDRQIARLTTTFQEAAASVHEFPISLRTPRKIPTPYGGQLQFVLPGGNNCIVHLKDPNLVRAGERWSQVMALYHVLGHKIMQMPNEAERKEQFADSSFVLFTSGTVRFKPEAVSRMLALMKQGNHIGATTCRLRPVGTGPVVWYQMFEYSMRYWMDRATEHMLGSLLRIRTGFTMFRASALMDDNVVKKFAVIPEDSKEFIQFRLGNEQWLCSLLLKQGYKVEYSAAVDVSIHVAETFTSYLRETQREFPLQVAAMADVTSNYQVILEKNENITLMYVGYLMMALVSAIFAPGTVFLVIITALVNLFQLNMFLALAANVAPILLLVIVCVFGSPRLQDLVIKILSAGYGLVMLAVLTSAIVQLHHSWFSASPVSIFMMAFLLSTLLPAVFHPQEMWNVLLAPVYFIAIPTTYLVTVVHSLCTFHLGNCPRKIGNDEEDLVQQIEKWEKIAKEAQNDPTKKSHPKVPSIDIIDELKKYLPDGKKSVSFHCGSFCGIVCCPPADESPLEGPFGDLIGRELLGLGKKLQMIEQRLRARRMGLHGFRPRVMPDGLSMPINLGRQPDWDQISEVSASLSVSTVRVPAKSAEEFYDKFGGRNLNNDKLTDWLLSLTDPSGPIVMENDHWMDDEELSKADADTLEPIEASFWRQLITTYVLPLTGTSAGLEEAMVEQLKKLRNKISVGFLMVNCLFILMVFLLELRREDLFILLPSPFSSSQKATAIHIEPTGIAFLLFFFMLMLVQFVAMLMHRWGTFSHLLASTRLSCCVGTKQIGFDHLRENAVQIARELQSLKNSSDLETDIGGTITDNRRKAAVSTLDVVFRKRFAAIQRTANHPRTDTITTTIKETSNAPVKNGQVVNRTLDSRKGVSRQPGDRPHVIQVFGIERPNSGSGDDHCSTQSTTSF